MYFLSCEMWDTLCTCLSYIGRSNQQAMGFNLSINLYGPMNLGLNLAPSSISLYFNWRNFLKNLIISQKLQGSPSFISTSFLSVPIICFQESSDACHLIKWWRKSSWPKRWFCCQCERHFTLIFHVNFSASIFTSSTIGSSMLSSNANVGLSHKVNELNANCNSLYVKTVNETNVKCNCYLLSDSQTPWCCYDLWISVHMTSWSGDPAWSRAGNWRAMSCNW